MKCFAFPITEGEKFFITYWKQYMYSVGGIFKQWEPE